MKKKFLFLSCLCFLFISQNIYADVGIRVSESTIKRWLSIFPKIQEKYWIAKREWAIAKRICGNKFSPFSVPSSNTPCKKHYLYALKNFSKYLIEANVLEKKISKISHVPISIIPKKTKKLFKKIQTKLKEYSKEVKKKEIPEIRVQIKNIAKIKKIPPLNSIKGFSYPKSYLKEKFLDYAKFFEKKGQLFLAARYYKKAFLLEKKNSEKKTKTWNTYIDLGKKIEQKKEGDDILYRHNLEHLITDKKKILKNFILDELSHAINYGDFNNLETIIKGSNKKIRKKIVDIISENRPSYIRAHTLYINDIYSSGKGTYKSYNEMIVSLLKKALPKKEYNEQIKSGIFYKMFHLEITITEEGMYQNNCNHAFGLLKMATLLEDKKNYLNLLLHKVFPDKHCWSTLLNKYSKNYILGEKFQNYVKSIRLKPKEIKNIFKTIKNNSKTSKRLKIIKKLFLSYANKNDIKNYFHNIITQKMTTLLEKYHFYYSEHKKLLHDIAYEKKMHVHPNQVAIQMRHEKMMDILLHMNHIHTISENIRKKTKNTIKTLGPRYKNIKLFFKKLLKMAELARKNSKRTQKNLKKTLASLPNKMDLHYQEYKYFGSHLLRDLASKYYSKAKNLEKDGMYWVAASFYKKASFWRRVFGNKEDADLLWNRYLNVLNKIKNSKKHTVGEKIGREHATLWGQYKDTSFNYFLTHDFVKKTNESHLSTKDMQRILLRIPNEMKDKILTITSDEYDHTTSKKDQLLLFFSKVFKKREFNRVFLNDYKNEIKVLNNQFKRSEDSLKTICNHYNAILKTASTLHEKSLFFKTFLYGIRLCTSSYSALTSSIKQHIKEYLYKISLTPSEIKKILNSIKYELPLLNLGSSIMKILYLKNNISLNKFLDIISSIHSRLDTLYENFEKMISSKEIGLLKLLKNASKEILIKLFKHLPIKKMMLMRQSFQKEVRNRKKEHKNFIFNTIRKKLVSLIKTLGKNLNSAQNKKAFQQILELQGVMIEENRTPSWKKFPVSKNNRSCSPKRIDRTYIDSNGKVRVGSMVHVPVSDQDGLGICYAHAASYMIDAWRFSHGDHNYDHLTAPLVVATIYKNIILNFFKGFFVSYPDFEGWFIEDAISDILKNGSCNKSIVGKTALFGALKKLYEYHGNLYELSKHSSSFSQFFNQYRHCKKGSSLLSPALKALLKNNSQIKKTFYEQSSLRKAIRKFAFAFCKKKGAFKKIKNSKNIRIFRSGGPIKEYIITSVFNYSKKYKKLIHKFLDGPEPVQPIGLRYCVSRALQGNQSCGPHASVIIGRRPIIRNGKKVCQLLIQNSWGTGCLKYMKLIAKGLLFCEKGKIWIDQDRLLKNTMGIRVMH